MKFVKIPPPLSKTQKMAKSPVENTELLICGRSLIVFESTPKARALVLYFQIPRARAHGTSTGARVP